MNHHVQEELRVHHLGLKVFDFVFQYLHIMLNICEIYCLI